MIYDAVSIDIIKEQSLYEVPIRRADDEFGYTSIRKSSRPVLSKSVKIDVSIDGFKVIDMAFLFELRAILEEFINKLLGEHGKNYVINSIMTPYDCEDLHVTISRRGSQLIITYISYGDKVECALDVIKAKTLYAILHKALQIVDF